ncbi:MAG: hypothetical protein NPIRA05_06060 [Nitrospirales bacterium]|nr:MAG: hypothetical protein NPIRA05_06060 [Nitrospirales bacterium]
MSKEASIVLYGIFAPYLFAAMAIIGCHFHILLFGGERREVDSCLEPLAQQGGSMSREKPKQDLRFQDSNVNSPPQ